MTLQTPELAQILADAPDCPGYGGGPWAIYGARCCWWTSDGATHGGRKPSGLPCCPHCGGVLFQAPLEDFLRSAEQAHPPAHLAAFIVAHNAPCHPSWDAYEVPS